MASRPGANSNSTNPQAVVCKGTRKEFRCPKSGGKPPRASQNRAEPSLRFYQTMEILRAPSGPMGYFCCGGGQVLPTSEGSHPLVEAPADETEGSTRDSANADSQAGRPLATSLSACLFDLRSATNPLSNIQHSTFNIQHSTFNIQHSTSNIQHRTSNIEQLS